MKYISFTLILAFLPALAQDTTSVKSDTTRLFKEFIEVGKEKKQVVDSMRVLQEKLDSTTSSEVAETTEYRKSYNVDSPNGSRRIWTFHYSIIRPGEGKKADTVFQGATIKQSKWK